MPSWSHFERRLAWHKSCRGNYADLLGRFPPIFVSPEVEDALSIDQRRALAMLSTAGSAGFTQALLSARGFDASMLASLVNRGLATLTTEKVRADEKPTAAATVEDHGSWTPCSRRGGLIECR
jgi:hypothetical protein